LLLDLWIGGHHQISPRQVSHTDGQQGAGCGGVQGRQEVEYCVADFWGRGLDRDCDYYYRGGGGGLRMEGDSDGGLRQGD